MSIPVAPTSGIGIPSQPRLVSLPQIPKIVQDLVDCVHQLKNEFGEQMSPITDDSQVLQRFCAKLEYLLQYEIKDRFTLLGKRKDYWDYFCECLGSNKGSNDGIRYVKSLGEHKTSLGKGRAFIRFALVHQRLADSLQQCIINQKTTSEWYNPASVWLQSKTSSAVVSILYDLNDIHFDLSPRGYDLDSAWPSFARKSSRSNNWNIPLSRRSSITSMDTISLSGASTADASEIDRLQQQLASAENAHAILSSTMGSLEQERQRAEQSVWMSQGELSAIQEQLKTTMADFTELQKQYTVLEMSHETLRSKKLEEDEQNKMKTEDLDMMQIKLAVERERLVGERDQMRGQLEEEKCKFQKEIQLVEHKLSEMEDLKDNLASKVQFLEEKLDQMRDWDSKKDQHISKLEQQIVSLEQRNLELSDDLAKSLSAREKDAENQHDSVKKFHDLLEKMKDVESQNIHLQANVVELKHKLTVAENTYQDELSKTSQLSAQLAEETLRKESVSVELRLKVEELKKAQRTALQCQEELQSELEKAHKELSQVTLDLSVKERHMSGAVSRHSKISGLLLHLLTAYGEAEALSGKIPDVVECDEEDLRTFVEVCQKSAAERKSLLDSKLKNLETANERLREEKYSLQQSVLRVLKCLPEQSDNSATELTQQTREMERKVQAICVQLSDLTRERNFLKEQLQGEHSDKGKQLSHLEGRLLELENMLKESRISESSLQSQLGNLQQKYDESENSLSLLKVSVSDLEGKHTAIVQESENLKQQYAAVLNDKERLHQEVDLQKHEKAHLEQQLLVKVAECERLNLTLEEKSTELVSFRNLHEEVVLRHKHDYSQLADQQQQAQTELIKVKEELNRATSHLSELVTNNCSLESQREELEKELKSSTSALQEKEHFTSEEIRNLSVQLEVFRLQKEDLQKSASSSEEEKLKIISERETSINDLEKHKSNLEQEKIELVEKCDALQRENSKYQLRIAEIEKTNQLEDKRQGAKWKLLNEEVQSLKEENMTLLEELKEVKYELSMKTEEIQKAKSEAESKKEESERLRSDSAAEKYELEDSLEKLQLRFCELQTSMDVIIKEKEDLMSLRDSMQEEIIELKQDLAASGDSYQFLLQSSQKVYEEKDNEIILMRSDIQQVEEKLKSLSSELDMVTQEKNSLEIKVWTLEKSEQDLQEENDVKHRLVDTRSKQIEELKQVVVSLTSSVTVLEEDARSKQDELDKAKTVLEEKENSYVTQIEALQQELSALQFQLSAEQMQHEESLRSMGSHESSLADMSTRLSDQEAVISHLEKELFSLQTSFETERSNMQMQLGDLKKLLKTKEMECKQLADSLQRTSDKLGESLSAGESLQLQNSLLRKNIDRDIEEREEEIRTLRSDNEQLKKQLIKVIREKAALWQQSDLLAYEHKCKAEKKWLDNSAVTQCMGCGSDFSLFLRKHHCRLCGRIFCYNCSDKWVESTSSSRKARACRRCFEDLQNLDVSVAKASLLPEFSDDDSSNMGSDIASPLDSQTDDRSNASFNQTTHTEFSLNSGADDENSSVQSCEDIYRSTGGSDERTGESTPDPTIPTPVSGLTTAGSDASLSESVSHDGAFQVITQEEVTKSIRAYDSSSMPQTTIDVPNMSSSLLLSAEDLLKGEINNQSEVRVKAGHSYVVPISIDAPFTAIDWEFTVAPKDIQFSIMYQYDESQPISKAEELMAPVRCNSMKEPVRGQLKAKKPGVYNLVFDNSYSKMTQKKIHYKLTCSRSS